MRPTTRLAIAAGTMLLLCVLPAGAQPEGDKAILNPTHTVADNLSRLSASAKSVELVLKNGKSYKGKLGSVGDHAVVVTQIEGREFFDALVLTDEIAAIEVRAR